MVFMILSVVIFFIVNDTNSTAEAKYPIYSLISSIICLSEVSEPYLYNLIPNSFICSSFKGEGASIMTSLPLLFFGKAI